jgi:hypothetical protein
MKKINNEKIKNLVLARLNAIPSDAVLNIPGAGSFSKDEMISRVEKEDEIGQKISEIELSFLKSIKTGSLYA